LKILAANLETPRSSSVAASENGAGEAGEAHGECGDEEGEEDMKLVFRGRRKFLTEAEDNAVSAGQV
jgi:hypothetical protein